jgi:hypothetical protein
VPHGRMLKHLSIAEQVAAVAQAYSSVETIPLEAVDRIRAALDSAPAAFLEQFVIQRVRFFDSMARLRLQRRFKYSDAKIAQLIAYRGQSPYEKPDVR